MTDLRPGQIWWAHTANGLKQRLIVSEERFNRGNYVTIVPITSKRVAERRALPNCVFLPSGQFCQTSDSVVQCEGIALVERTYLSIEDGMIAELDATTMREVIRAVGVVIGAECEPGPE